MSALDRLKAAWDALKSAGHDTIDDFTGLLDNESKRRYICKICEEDAVDEAEAWRLVREDPKYSLGMKLCSPIVIAEMSTRKGQSKFRDMLTTEERRIWDEEVVGHINIKKAIKDEVRKQKKKMRS